MCTVMKEKRSVVKTRSSELMKESEMETDNWQSVLVFNCPVYISSVAIRFVVER